MPCDEIDMPEPRPRRRDAISTTGAVSLAYMKGERTIRDR